MAPANLFNQSGGTAEDRRAEADRIIGLLQDAVTPDEMEPREAEFIFDLHDSDRPVSPKMLFWLRDIKDKYL